MSLAMKLLGLSAGVAAIAAAAPAGAQYYGQNYGSYGYNQNYGSRYGAYGQNYGYSNQNYGSRYGAYGQNYAYGANTNLAAQQCTAAVQNRLYNRSSIGGILGAVLGTNTTGRVLSITQAEPRRDGTVRVRGLASSGRYASNGYGAYGAGAYGALGYGYANAADLSFRCDVGMNGQVYDVRLNRR